MVQQTIKKRPRLSHEHLHAARLTAEPRPIRLAPYMRQIADAIGDPSGGENARVDLLELILDRC